MRTIFRLEEVRKVRKISQATLARKMGLKQAGLSQLERREIIKTESLRKYVESLGGLLTITAEFEDGDIFTLSPYSSEKYDDIRGTLAVTKELLNDAKFVAGLNELIYKLLQK